MSTLRQRGASSNPKVKAEAKGGTVKAPTRKGHIRAVLIITALVAFAYAYYTQFLLEKVDHEPHDPGALPFKVMDIPGKGKGAIATRDIEQGELILREAPLFTVPTKVTTSSPGALLLHAVAKLSPQQRASFYNLSYVNLPVYAIPDTPSYNDELALAIFQTNAVSAGADTVGIFPTMARLNHGCSSAFNAVYSWRQQEGVIVVHALKPVRAGEELLTTYLGTRTPRDIRRQYLHSAYGFTCTCSVCSLPEEESKASDARLTEMSDLYTQFASWGQGIISGKAAVDIARRIWALGEAEGYISERGQLAADAALVAAAHSDEEATRPWAAVAKRWYGFELGADSDQARQMETVISRPSSHGMWGQRRPEKVGGPDGRLE